MIAIAFAAAAVMASAVAVVLIAVVVSVRGEDRRGALPHHAPTLIGRGVRRLTGLRICQPGEAGLQQTPFMQKATSQIDRTPQSPSSAQVTDQPPRSQTGCNNGSGSETVTGNRRPA